MIDRQTTLICYFYRALLQKRPMILSILLTKATPYIYIPVYIPIGIYDRQTDNILFDIFIYYIGMYDRYTDTNCIKGWILKLCLCLSCIWGGYNE